MDKNYFIKLTTNLYRLTILFPKKEPLRYKIRELADNILANCILIFKKEPSQSKKLILEIKEYVDVLDSYLELAKSQNWVSPFDVLEIQKEYANLIGELNRSEESKTRVLIPETVNRVVVVEEESIQGKEDRQDKILEFLRQRGRAQVGELQQILPDISKRTLRRDFEFLLKQGIVERIGEQSSTFYQLLSSAKPSEARDETKFQRAKDRTQG